MKKKVGREGRNDQYMLGIVETDKIIKNFSQDLKGWGDFNGKQHGIKYQYRPKVSFEKMVQGRNHPDW
jgi:hypothetical protein